MKEEKEIKRKKKSKKKKDFPQEKNEALDKVQHNHSIFPDPNAISCSIISPSREIEIAEKASEHGRGSAQPNILEPNNFIESDTKADASQSAKQDEVQTIVNNIPDNENRKESHDTTETVSNVGTLCTDNEASSILENECNNISSAIVRQANGYSNCQKSILSDVTHIENTSIYFPTDFSRDASINHLKICLESELKSSQLLRLQISTLEELIVIRDADEARTKTQVERLRTENECLEKEVLKLKDMVKLLMLDRSKLLAKMVILQNGERVVDEVDVSVDGSPIYQQIDESTPDCTKEGSVFPSTSGTLAVKAVSEPSIQTTVTATIVDNLVPETVKLIPQEKQYDTSAASQGSDVCLAKHKPAGIFSTVKSQRDEAALIVPSEPVSVTLDSDKVNNQAGNLTWSAGSRKELERKEALEIKDIERSNSSVEIESIIESEENNDTTKDTYLAPSNELLGKSSSSDNYQHPNLPKVKFSDAPLIGAPFRLVSFMTRFVSGADLAAKSDR